MLPASPPGASLFLFFVSKACGCRQQPAPRAIRKREARFSILLRQAAPSRTTLNEARLLYTASQQQKWGPSGAEAVA